MSSVICFDLEGPLSPQDNAYEVMGLFENGLRIFETISKYDDLLALDEKEGYEAGDTLSLIAPFLVHHKITEKNITEVSEKAILVDGAKGLIEDLQIKDWEVYIISTSYEQHAFNIGNQLGVPKEKIYCTSFPLDKYNQEFQDTDQSLIKDAEKEIMEMYPPLNDMKVKMRLDRFFWGNLPKTPLVRIMEEMKVVGGQRKVDAAKKIAQKHDVDLSDIIVVGDSITDLKMLDAVNKAGGLSIAFNGNRYAIPKATMGLATTNMLDLLNILVHWKDGGRDAAIAAFSDIKVKREPYIHVLVDRDNYDDVVDVHKKVRKIVRGRAAKLG
jgi:energy-converting hydrogenase A subunit R